MSEDERFEADEKRRIATLHKTAPETIWLQVDEEAEQFDGWEAITWCGDQINGTDLQYVRVDVVESLSLQLDAANNLITTYRDEATSLRQQLAEVKNWSACESAANIPAVLEYVGQIEHQLAIAPAKGASLRRLYAVSKENADLHRQVKLLRDALEDCHMTNPCDTNNQEKAFYKAQQALAATAIDLAIAMAAKAAT